MDSHDRADHITSGWPLPGPGARFLLPQALVEALAGHPLTADLHPLAVGYYPRAVGHAMRRRSHDSHLLIYCVAGEGWLEIDGARRPVGPGDLMLLRSGLRHAYAASADDPWSIFWVHYQGTLADDYTDFIAEAAPLLPVGVQPRLIDAFKALLGMRSAGFALPALIRYSCQLKSLLTAFGGAAGDTRTAARRRFDLDAVIAHMERHLQSELDLEALAKVANLSRFHFIRSFKALTGQTPIQYFIEMKMQAACALLDHSGEPVQAIAGRLGYDDPLYFSRLFKRVVGMSPLHYRQQHVI